MTSHILAEIAFLTPEQGGRLKFIVKGEYRGVFAVDDEHFSAFFLVPSESGFVLGETYNVEVQFLFPDAALPCFPVGKVFTIWEGRTIGHGKVFEVLR